MWKKVRLFFAIICLLGFTLLFLDHSEQSWLAVHLAFLAKIQLVPAVLATSFSLVVVILAVTLVYGRIYCSVVCPLGLLQDLLLSLRPKGTYRYLPGLAWLRWPLLIIFVLALILGWPLVTDLLEPYSAFGRICTDLGKPLATLINNGLEWITRDSASYVLQPKEIFCLGAGALYTAIATLLILLVLTLKYGRVWCSSVCPVGSFLGLLARFALFRPRIRADLCTHCGQCARNCKANCIDAQKSTIDSTRCIACFNCEDVCKFNALTFTPNTAPKAAASSRRHALALVAGGCIGLLQHATSSMAAETKKSEAEILALTYKPRRTHATPILPPGAESQFHFTAHCTGCQLCVAACPNKVLLSSDQGETLLKPALSFEHGFCRPNCVVCGTVCPTGAIKPITKQEKTAIQIGRAVVDHTKCVVTTDKVVCTACQRNCPTGAITLVGAGNLKQPAVNQEKCIGCGACEFYCPARPLAAIKVEGTSVHHRI